MIGSRAKSSPRLHYHFLVVVIGNLEQHFGQRAGLIADVHHAADHPGKDAGGLEGCRDRFASFTLS